MLKICKLQIWGLEYEHFGVGAFDLPQFLKSPHPEVLKSLKLLQHQLQMQYLIRVSSGQKSQISFKPSKSGVHEDLGVIPETQFLSSPTNEGRTGIE